MSICADPKRYILEGLHACISSVASRRGGNPNGRPPLVAGPLDGNIPYAHSNFHERYEDDHIMYIHVHIHIYYVVHQLILPTKVTFCNTCLSSISIYIHIYIYICIFPERPIRAQPIRARGGPQGQGGPQGPRVGRSRGVLGAIRCNNQIWMQQSRAFVETWLFLLDATYRS